MIELQNEINSTTLYKGPKPQTTIEIPEFIELSIKIGLFRI